MFNLYRGDIPIYVRDAFGGELPNGMEVKLVEPNEGETYERAMRTAFEFIRRNGAGRYTSGTLMRILTAADTAERARSRGGELVDGPVLLTLGKPFRFDELTEVKTGGPVAMAVYFPAESGRLILAVNKDHRRKKFGKVLGFLVRGGASQVTAWVNQRNAEGQQFLLSLGLIPTSMNSAGGVCYTLGVEAEGGEEESPLALSARARRDRLAGRV